MPTADDIKMVNVWTRVPKELNKALNVAAAQAGVSRPKMLAEAIEMWLAAENRGEGEAWRTAKAATEPTIPQDYIGLVAKLVAVLDHAPEIVKTALRSNLEAYFSLGVPRSKVNKGR